MRKQIVFTILVILLAAGVYAANTSLNITINLSNTSCTQTTTCGSWSSCSGSSRSRNCYYNNYNSSCGSILNFTDTSSCSSGGSSSGINTVGIYCNERVQCTNWTGCSNSIQTRGCTASAICGFSSQRYCLNPAEPVQTTCINNTIENNITIEKNVTGVCSFYDSEKIVEYLVISFIGLMCLAILLDIFNFFRRKNKVVLSPNQTKLFLPLYYRFFEDNEKVDNLLSEAKIKGWKEKDFKHCIKQIKKIDKYYSKRMKTKKKEKHINKRNNEK